MRTRCGFSLVELIAVMVVLGILAAVAAPRFFDLSDDAEVSAAKGARVALQQAVRNWALDQAVREGGETAFPPNLDDVLASQDGNHKLNPYHDARMPVYNIDRGGEAKVHPRHKTIERAVQSRWGSIWYNPDNGLVRFRVPEQGASDATLDLYNEVNATSVTSANQTTR